MSASASPWLCPLSTHPALVVHIQGLCAKTAIRLDFCWGEAMRCVQLVWKRRAICGKRDGREGGQSELLAGQQLFVICSLWGRSVRCYIWTSGDLILGNHCELGSICDAIKWKHCGVVWGSLDILWCIPLYGPVLHHFLYNRSITIERETVWI